MNNNSLAHTKWECKYHIVFATKYRRQEDIAADSISIKEYVDPFESKKIKARRDSQRKKAVGGPFSSS